MALHVNSLRFEVRKKGFKGGLRPALGGLTRGAAAWSRGTGPWQREG